jgi:hypothetical protein
VEKRRLFVDPGSKSAGWALYEGPNFIASGTCAAEGVNPFTRLNVVLRLLSQQLNDKWPVDEAHIERLNYKTHYICLWSVGVLGSYLAGRGAEVQQDIDISPWQKHNNWKEEKGDWKTHGFASEDEFAAVCMGRWWLWKQGISK